MAAIAVLLVALNAVSFALFGIDKRRARRGARRIPEATLLLSALVSGTVGAWLGMRVFHHKTRKRSFLAVHGAGHRRRRRRPRPRAAR